MIPSAAPHRPARWLLVLALAGACRCEGTPNQPSLVLTGGVPVIAPQLDFGNVQLGQTTALPLPLQNSGTSPLQISTQTVAGAPFAEATAFASGVAVSSHTNAVITFTPTQTGAATGTLTLDDDGTPSQVTVSLIGNGVNLALSVQPTSLSFGPVSVGLQPAPSQNVTFQNGTDAPVYLVISTASTASEYTVSNTAAAAVTATPIEIQPGASFVATVAFAPDLVSIFNSSFLYTACEDAAGTICLLGQSFPLTGAGVTGTLALTPNPVVFSDVPAGDTAKQTITVTNVGGGSATLSCLYLESQGSSACGTSSALFKLGAPSTALPTVLEPNGSLTLDLTYNAEAATGADVLAATYTSTGATATATATDALQGTAAPAPCAIAITPAVLTFPSVNVGVPISGSVTVSNVGGQSCQVSGVAVAAPSDPSYALTAGQATSFALAAAGAAGASATIGVTFDLDNGSPPSSRIGELDFRSTDSTHAMVKVPMLATLASPYAGGGAWPRWKHDNLQSGVSPNDTSGLTGTIAWTAKLGTPSPTVWSGLYGTVLNDFMNSPVVGSDGTIYELGFDGSLRAFNPDGGAQWNTFLASPVVDSHPSTPIIASDGTLFVAMGDVNNLPDGGRQGTRAGLYEISPAGQILATIPPAEAGDGFDLPPILTNGGLLLGADDEADPTANGEGAAFAFSISAGSVFNLAGATPMSTYGDQYSAVVGPDDSSYWCGGSLCYALTSPGAGFSALSGWPAGGTVAHQKSTEGSDLALDVGFTGNLMVLFGGWCDFIPKVRGAQELASIDPATGTVLWSRILPAPTTAQVNADPNYLEINDATVGNSGPVIGLDGTVYVGNFDGLHAVDGTTGVEKTGFPFLTTSNVLTAPAIGGDGTIFFGTANGTFYAINPTGTLRFSLHAGGRIAGSPAIGPGGAVYFVANDGNLYAVN